MKKMIESILISLVVVVSFVWSAQAEVKASTPSVNVSPIAPTRPVRSSDLSVQNVVRVTTSVIVVEQTQTFKGEFLNVLWTVLDVDKNGKLSAEEKKNADKQLKGFYLDYSGIRLNWYVMAPNKLDVDVKGMPNKKPKEAAKGAPVTVSFRVSYDYIPNFSDVVELLSPNLNAHEVKTKFVLAPSLMLFRINFGKIVSPQETDGMVQVDGYPDIFTAIISNQYPPHTHGDEK
ncbi:MAG TPA: hypothetical protein PK876_06295 [Elusimicrobiota bacterium]|nr:hypothetical protein [Elusimicrobiota bacterium]HRY30484.1 hypothetical protein [Elusimicrobiota bacterium]